MKLFTFPYVLTKVNSYMHMLLEKILLQVSTRLQQVPYITTSFLFLLAIYIHISINTFKYVRIYTLYNMLCLYKFKCMHTHTQTHTQMHTSMYIYTYTQISCVQSHSCLLYS